MDVITPHLKRAFLILALLVSSVFGEQPWPKHIAGVTFAEANTSALPKALCDSLLTFDEFSQDVDKLPDTLEVSRFDIHGDGTDGFIIISNQSYSGGPMMYVFERRKEKYVCIATLQGQIYFGPRVNGCFQIVSQSRGGAGISTRELFRYQHGKYHLVRIADYRLSEMSGDFEFIRERNPAGYDN